MRALSGNTRVESPLLGVEAAVRLVALECMYSAWFSISTLTFSLDVLVLNGLVAGASA